MGWHYQAMKKTYRTIFDDRIDEETLVELAEVYPEASPDGADGISWTDKGVAVTGESREDLADWLERAARDVLKHDVVDGGIVTRDLRRSAAKKDQPS